MKTDKEVAKEIINSYFHSFNNSISLEGFSELISINQDDKVLLRHIKAMKQIFAKAEKELKAELKAKEEK